MNAPFNRTRGPVFHEDLIQGSDEWLAARCGLLTASEMKLIVTPGTLKRASNDKERAHMYELLAQRISGYVEPSYISDDMLRGMDDEAEARRIYAETFAEAPVTTVGFITNDKFGFTIGYSPDALVGDHGLIECKSRRQKFQIQTIVENVCSETIPAEFLIQHQTGMAVAERPWCDFVSYSGGLPMAVVRVHADTVIQDAIIDAASEFEARLTKRLGEYREALASDARLIPTERRVVQEMYV